MAPHRTRRRPRLSDEAADHVRELIVSGRIRAGEFIRPEMVAEDLDISATPAREGLLSLLSEGFLRIEPRRGFVVTPLSGDDVRDVFVAQSLLAGELAARAATKMSAADVDALESLQDDLEQAAAAGDFDTEESLNHEFHRRVYRAADSPKLSWMIKASLGYAPRTFFSSVEGWPEASTADHRAILGALRESDADAARAAMIRHIQNAGNLLAEHRSSADG